MASWRTDWKAITDRMAGLFSAAQFYLNSRSIHNMDYGGIGNKILLPQVAFLMGRLKDFENNHKHSIPREAAFELEEYFGLYLGKFMEIPGKVDDPIGDIQFRFVSLKAFITELDALLSDTKTHLLRLTERAFMHLQRLIVVDEDTGRKWRNAFKAGETMCERLGAVHLLWHGIWAFKADAKGERTDLIMGEPIDSNKLEEIGNSAEALILTEWKIAKEKQDIHKQIEKGVRQAKRYSRGALGGIELRDYRYIVLVTNENCAPPLIPAEDGIEYKVINLAVEPAVPSRNRGGK